ncbi:MAG TPA: universal stress protein [Pseudomonadaceae bacterium]|nr:universal stress protein [Pseudomonadaceae bacterium]
MTSRNLFVIIDPTQKTQPALVRAADIAGQMGAHLHIFCCDYVEDEDLVKFKSRSDAKRQTLKKAKALVDKLVAPLRKQGLSLSTEVIWNAGWYQAATHASAREAADLIIKSSYPRKGRQHPLRERSDFYLIRNSTCPILLTRSGVSHQLNKVLAAVTLEKDYKKEHALLNNRIVANAKRISRGTGAELHLVAALSGTANIPKLLDMHLDKEQELKTEQEMIAERFGVDLDKVHVKKGAADKVISKVAKDLDAQVLILGTKARKGLKGALLGNTAEKVLDRLQIDIQVIN